MKPNKLLLLIIGLIVWLVSFSINAGIVVNYHNPLNRPVSVNLSISFFEGAAPSCTTSTNVPVTKSLGAYGIGAPSTCSGNNGTYVVTQCGSTIWSGGSGTAELETTGLVRSATCPTNYKYAVVGFFLNGTLQSSKSIGPGETATYTHTILKCENFTATEDMRVYDTVVNFDGPGQWSLNTIGEQTNSTTTFTGGSAGSTTSTNTQYGGGAGGVQQISGASKSTNGVINFGGLSGDGVLQAGFNSLLEESKKQTALQFQNATNSVSLNISNLTFTNISDAGTHSRLDTVTNLLGALGNTNDDLGRIGALGARLLGSSGVMTNLSGARAMADAAIGDATSDLDDKIGAITTPEAGEGTDWDIDIAAGDFHFIINPITDARFTSLWSTIHSLFTWFLGLTFISLVINQIYECGKIFVANHGVQVPNVNATILGIGGNWGVFVWAGIVVALLAVYLLFLMVVSTSLVGGLGFSGLAGMIAANPFESMNGMALKLLVTIFPLQLAINLAVAYVVFRLTVFKVLAALIGAQKILAGS